MNRCRLLFAALLGTLVYVGVSIGCGRNGIWATKQLQEQRRILSAHTAGIEKTNEELTLESLALQNDPDVIAAYARKLGYVREGEKLVKVVGLPARETRISDPGFTMKHQEVLYMPEWFCKSIGLIFFSLVYLVLLLIDVAKGNISFKKQSKYYKVVKGTTVYEMPEM